MSTAKITLRLWLIWAGIWIESLAFGLVGAILEGNPDPDRDSRRHFHAKLDELRAELAALRKIQRFTWQIRRLTAAIKTAQGQQK